MAKLLVVDDDVTIRELLQTLLERDGHTCITAGDGRVARELLAEHPFDLMLVDIRMPGESGLELAYHVRQTRPDMGIVVVSVITDPSEVRAALDLGVFGYVVKPFDKSQVLISVRKALRLRELERHCAERRESLEKAVEERSRELSDLVERLSAAQKDSQEQAERLANQVGLLQVFLDAMPTPVYHQDRQGVILGCNTAFAAHMGRAQEEIAGRILPHLAPAMAAGLQASDAQLLGTGGRDVRETRLMYPDGTVQDVLITRAAYRDAQGAIGGLVTVFVDITERREMELRLEQNERYQKAIWDATPSGVVLVDPATQRIADVNPQAARMIGLPAEEIIGRTCRGFLCPTNVEHCPIDDPGKPGGGEESTLLTADGRSVPVLRAVTAIDVDGRDLLIETFLDISDRRRAEQALKASEEKMRQILENIGIGVTMISTDMRILEMNRQMRNWFPSLNVAAQPHCYTAFNDPPRNALCEYCPTIRTLSDGQVHEAFTQTPSGDSVRNFRIVASPIHDADGKVMAAIEMVEDATERQLLEKELRQAQKLESIGQLAAGIAHEINTPTQYVGDNTRFLQEVFGELLDVVRSAGELIAAARQGCSPEDLIRPLEDRLSTVDLNYIAKEVPQAIEQTLEGVNRIMRIVRSMKEFSHPGSSERTLTDINKALDTTITVARNEWKYVAEVEMDLDPNLPATQCFAGELNQVFLNILINAAHAIGDVVDRANNEKGKIRVSSHREGPWVEVRFSDTGPGIPKSIQHRVFDPFFTTKQVGKGTGQGLAIAHRVVVEKHGGTLSFETEEGAGTTFIIRLPIEPGESEKAA
jgi:two-component system NtrC family sensor kinase